MVDRHNRTKQPGLASGVVTMGMVVAILVWGITALTNEDPLWFLHRFDARAEAITIYWDGDSYRLEPADSGYNQVMTAFDEAISHPAGFEWSVAFSQQGIENYRSRFRLVEIRFEQPVQVHTRHPYPEAATYLIPLSETHAYARRAFAFPGLVPYTSGPLILGEEHFSALYRAVETAVEGL
jgi:hypothetical protein